MVQKERAGLDEGAKPAAPRRPGGRQDRQPVPAHEPDDSGLEPESWRHLVAGPMGATLPKRGPSTGTTTVRDQLAELEQIPQRPRRVFNWRHVLALARRTTDFFGHRRTWWGRLLGRVNPYPKPFRAVNIPSSDGTQISAWLGLQSGRRPGVVIVPGMFSSKDDSSHKRKAIRMWRRWNYNVLIIDLRGFGQSEDSPNTPGWKEAEDVLAAARYLYGFNTVTGVSLVGDSLGGAACLLAAAQEGLWERRALEDKPLSPKDEWGLPGVAPVLAGTLGDHEGGPPHNGEPVGAKPANAGPGGAAAADGASKDTSEFRMQRPSARGTTSAPVLGIGRLPVRVIQAVVAISPFTDPELAINHINRMPARRDPFYHVQRMMIRLLSMRTKGQHRDFCAFMEVSAAHYGVPLEEVYERSDVLSVAHEIRAPTLVLHAEDDPTVSVTHSRRLKEKVQDMDHVGIWILPWGRHVEFDLLDHRWYWWVLAGFLGRRAGP